MTRNRKASATHLGSYSLLLGIIAVAATFLVCWSMFEHFGGFSGLSDINDRRLFNSKFSFNSHDQYDQVKKLFDETKILLNELSVTNITLSRQTKTQIQDMESERKIIRSEIDILQNEKSQLQSHLADCILEKHSAIDRLNQCELKSPQLASDHERPLLLEKPKEGISTYSPSSEELKKWLVIGIPTLSRPNNENYLLRTLASIASQLPSDSSSIFYKQILIAVVHVVPSSEGVQHIRYQEAKKLYENNPHFLFDELLPAEVYSDPKVGSNPNNDVGNANVPGYRVRKQSRNLAAVTKKVAALGKYYLYLEDDMEFCPYVIHAINYMIEKSSRYHPNWLAIRASYGMNGIVLKAPDALVFAEYLIKHQSRRPPDHLVVEWYAGESSESKQHKGNRVNIGFKYNLFNHIGHVSTLRSERQTSFPVCYDLLVEPTVFKVEAFSLHECPKDDVWPCNVKHREPTYIHWDQVAK